MTAYQQTDATGSYQLDSAKSGDTELLASLFNSAEYTRWINAFRREDEALHHAAVQRRSTELIVQFQDQWAGKIDDFSTELQNDVEKYVRLIIVFLTRLSNIKRVKLTVTDDHSIFFRVSHFHLNGYLELHFGDQEPLELVYTLFKNKKPLPAYGGPVEQTLIQYFAAISA